MERPHPDQGQIDSPALGRLSALLEELFDEMPTQPDEQALFTEIDTWDSLKYVRLVMGIEAEFEIELAPEDIRRLTSVAAVKGVLRERGITL